MAFYRDSDNVKKSDQPDRYSKIWSPGENPNPCGAGIYRCQSCGYEDVINRACTKLPPCTNCEEKGHKNNKWKLLVRAENAK